ncbi:MAG: formate/nitrite transporter family protein [Hyphomicrobiales bacterium]|nr:formate/nitrite transporter family protein [Hyphomicrobiales bacterium]
MTPEETVIGFAETARAKANFLQDNQLGFAIAAMMAGAYVGMGILLIFSVGQGVDPSMRPIVMGLSFGIALTLVIFAGSELFTGHAMYMTHGRLAGSVTTGEVARCWAASWVGNLIGSAGLAALFVAGGSGLVLKAGGVDLMHAVAAKKMNASALELISRAMLCNWLVCLAIWMSARTRNDTAKCILIFWCLYVFIAAGFEHSVANMTVFSVALFSEHPETITYSGAAYNLFWVTLGNAASGAILMGLAYWAVAGRPRLNKHPSQPK